VNVINKSHYWKAPLLRSADWLEKLRVREDIVDKTLARVERELLIGFYAIRKLLDTFKISETTRKMMFELKWSPNLKQTDYLNAHRIDELFQLEWSLSETRDLEFVCHQFVHSFIFVPVQREQGELSGFYLSSDRSRHERLYFISLSQVLSAFRTVGRDYPTSLRLRRNLKTQQWETSG
jgi:hypothetical protein